MLNWLIPALWAFTGLWIALQELPESKLPESVPDQPVDPRIMKLREQLSDLLYEELEHELHYGPHYCWLYWEILDFDCYRIVKREIKEELARRGSAPHFSSYEEKLSRCDEGQLRRLYWLAAHALDYCRWMRNPFAGRHFCAADCQCGAGFLRNEMRQINAELVRRGLSPEC